MLTVAVAGFYYYVMDNMKPLYESSDKQSFFVGSGESLTTISANLYQQGLVKSEIVFKYYGIYKDYQQKLKEGEYELSPGYSVEDVYRILIEGKQELISVTIPEGYTARKISTILEKKGVTSASEFMTAIRNEALLDLYNIPFESAEGFLFPDTYNFQEGYPAIRVVESLVKNFFNNIEEIYPRYKQLTDKQLAEMVILASIVEREYKSKTEVKTIASVFYNRLDMGMKLQSCATVMFVLTEELGEKHRNRLFFEDLEVDSLYNTYLVEGLPPGAISNPGFYALEAAFYPETTDYVYFVVKDRQKGLHRFSSNYSDHEAARLDYLSGFESKY